MAGYFKAVVYRVMLRLMKEEKDLLLSRTQLLDAKRHNPHEASHIDRLLALCDAEISRRNAHRGADEAAAHLAAVVTSTQMLADNKSMAQNAGRELFGDDWRRKFMPYGADDAVQLGLADSLTEQTLGDCLVYHMMEDRFGLNTDAMVAKIPESVRGTIAGYIPFFLAWFSTVQLASIHGEPVSASVREAMTTCFRRFNEIQPGIGDEGVRGVELLFGALDRAVWEKRDLVDGHELPFEVNAAFALIKTSPRDEPLFTLAQTGELAFDFAEVLEDARLQASASITALLGRLVVTPTE